PFTTLQAAMQRFFQKKAKHPQFKKKGKCRDSFYVANDKFSVDGKSVKLPVIGKIKMTEELRFRGKISYAVISRTADRWFISISMETELPKLKRGTKTLGGDLGIKTSATCSDGTIYQSPKPLCKLKRKLALAQRGVSRKVKGSSNRTKAINKLAKLHWRCSNVRDDFLHKTTTNICRESQAVAIEDLSVRGMMGNPKLARALSDQSFSEFRRQLTYKAEAYVVRLLVVDRFFPSSKTCSSCGSVKPTLTLSERTYRCDSCAIEIDRDLNAAINLMNKLGAASPEVKPVDQQNSRSRLRLGAGMKQEFKGGHFCSLGK
ncbi:MAG: transposase, partial [Alphaproteobacteria bacterium]|nr:transposase [Alphaproteobacteria bacterium]